MAISETSELSSGDLLLSRFDEYLFKVESLFNIIAGIVIFAVLLMFLGSFRSAAIVFAVFRRILQR